MFDFIKMEACDVRTCNALLSNSLLTFSTQVNESTGEILSDKKVANYGNMVFNVYPNGRLFISGSLHKLYNFTLGHATNHDVFTYQKLRYIIDFLQDRFQLNPDVLSIHNLEFGVNVHPKEPVNKILGLFIVYKQYPFNKMVFRGPGRGLDCYLNEYGIKVYNKGLQYRYRENILRFEKKVIKMRSEFNKHLVLSDLLDKTIWFHCANSLFKAFEDIIVTEKLPLVTMSKSDLKVYKECQNPRVWAEFTRRQRCQKKERFNQIIKMNGQLKLKSQLKSLMYGAIDEMLCLTNNQPYTMDSSGGINKPNHECVFLDEQKQVTFPLVHKKKLVTFPPFK